MSVLVFAVFLVLSAQVDTDSGRELDLAGWVALAYRNSPDISSADASLLSARAAYTGSRAFLWPTLSLSAATSKTWSGSVMPDGGVVNSEANSFSTNLSLSQEVLQSGGQHWLELEASKLSLMASQAEYRGNLLSVTVEVAEAYYSVLEALELKKSAEAAHERSLEQLEQIQRLYEIGAVTTLQLLQIEVQESADRLSVNRRDQALFSAYRNLYNAAGMDPVTCDLTIKTDAVIEPLPLEAVHGIPLDYSENPSLEAAVLRNRASELQAEATERLYWPSLRASAGWSWSDNTMEDIDRMFDTDRFNVGITLSWNIFDGFLRESRIKTARASFLSSSASLESMENSIKASVESLKNTLETDIQYYDDSALMLEQAQEQYRLSLMSYGMGALSLLDLLDAQADLSQAEANLVSAGIAALKSEASLMVQLGRMPRIGE